jgi:hypothetical protein
MPYRERPIETILKILTSKTSQAIVTKDELLYLMTQAMLEIYRLESIVNTNDNSKKNNIMGMSDGWEEKA